MSTLPPSFHSRAVLYAKVATSHMWRFRLQVNKISKVPQSHQPHFECSTVTHSQRLPYWRADNEYPHHCVEFYWTALPQRLLSAQPTFKVSSWGTQVAQSVERPTLNFSSAHDLAQSVTSSPTSGSALSQLKSLSFCCLSPLLTHTLFTHTHTHRKKASS